MIRHDSSSAPSIDWKRSDETVSNQVFRLTTADHKFVVRLTGGCGCMSPEDARGLEELFAEAFWDYKGSFLFGGTRMIMRNNPTEVVYGITEIPPMLRKRFGIKILGVIPQTGQVFYNKLGLVIRDNEEEDYITIAHPDQDICIMVHKSVNTPASWDDEYIECQNIISTLTGFGDFKSLTISYNGGVVTEKEILAAAGLGFPVLLIRGSGRTTDKLAEDIGFLSRHPHVLVAEKTSRSIREVLVRVGALPVTANHGTITDLKQAQ